MNYISQALFFFKGGEKMSNDYQHIVKMEMCKTCKHYGKPETEDPCFECMYEPVNYATRKPTKYEEAEKK